MFLQDKIAFRAVLAVTVQKLICAADGGLDRADDPCMVCRGGFADDDVHSVIADNVRVHFLELTGTGVSEGVCGDLVVVPIVREVGVAEVGNKGVEFGQVVEQEGLELGFTLG